MLGTNEILIIAAVIVGALVVPRMIKPPKQAPRIVQRRKKLSGAWRMAVAASIVYPLVVAAIVQPWRGDLLVYLYLGLGPVFIAWLLYWVIQGYARR